MPQIETLRLGRWLWVGWHENDFHARSHVKIGWSDRHVRDRVFAALDSEDHQD